MLQNIVYDVAWLIRYFLLSAYLTVSAYFQCKMIPTLLRYFPAAINSKDICMRRNMFRLVFSIKAIRSRLVVILI